MNAFTSRSSKELEGPHEPLRGDEREVDDKGYVEKEVLSKTLSERVRTKKLKDIQAGMFHLQ